MPTQSTTYNTRLTDEALEKRFRDTFRSQGGAELVDDLYASGVIVPVVDFTAAAEGSALREDLQKAWDDTTQHVDIQTTTPTTIISNAGFWKVWVVHTGYDVRSAAVSAKIVIDSGLSQKTVWQRTSIASSTIPVDLDSVVSAEFVVFVRSGRTVTANAQTNGGDHLNISYRQIADVSGNLIQPSGYTSS